MRLYLFFILFIISLKINSQTEFDLYRYNSIDFDSVSVESRYKNKPNNIISKTIKIFDKGVEVQNKVISNGRLHSITKKEYSDNELTKKRYFSRVYRGLDSIGKFNKDNYKESKYFYKNKELSKIMIFTNSNGFHNKAHEVVYEYDNVNRLIKYSYSDTNNDIIKSSFHKTYHHSVDRLTVKYFVNEKLTEYKYIFGTLEHPNKIESFDKNDSPLNRLDIKRNHLGLINEVDINTYKAISVRGLEPSMPNYNKIKIKYNQKMNPVRIEYLNDEILISYTEFKYYPE